MYRRPDSTSSLPKAPSSGAYQIEQTLPTSGNVRVITILMQFPDLQFQNQSTINDVIDEKLNSQNTVQYKGVTYGSVNEYFAESSYGDLNIEFDVFGPFTAEHDIEYYNDGELGTPSVDSLIIEAIDFADPFVSYSNYDNNNDDEVDVVHVLYAGKANSDNDLWPHCGYIYQKSADGRSFGRYIVTSELFRNEISPIGTICHELGHAMGSPDYYDTNKEVDGQRYGTGYWDLMGSGGWNIDKNCPALPNPYARKVVFGWTRVTPIAYNNEEEFTIYPAALHSHEESDIVYSMSFGDENNPEYFIFENRQKVGFDRGLPGHGMLVWHVHPDIDNSQYNNIGSVQRLYPLHAHRGNEVRNGEFSSNNDEVPFPGFLDNHYISGVTSPGFVGWNNQALDKSVCSIREIPYAGTNIIKFIYNQKINGSPTICDEETYSLDCIPDGATVNWSYEGYNPMSLIRPLNIISGQGTNVATYKRGTAQYVGPFSSSHSTIVPFVGEKTITARISYGDRQYIFSKNIETDETQVPNIESYEYVPTWYTDNTRTFFLNEPDTDPNDIKWTVKETGKDSVVSYGLNVNITPTNVGVLSITAQRLNTCPGSNIATETYNILKRQIITPLYVNPVEGNSVDIMIVEQVESTATSSTTCSYAPPAPTQYNGAYRLELWHEIYGLVREIDVQENNPSTTMDLSALPKGTYHLRLIIEEELVDVSQMVLE